MLALGLLVVLASPQETSEPLSTLLQELPAVAAARDEIFEDQVEHARKIRAYRAEAIAPLLQMLSDAGPREQNLINFTLRTIDGWNESHLELLLAVQNRYDASFVALRKIATARSIQHLVHEFHFQSATSTQLGFLLGEAGALGAKLLGEALAGDAANQKFLEAACEVFERSKADMSAAIYPLIRAANDAELASDQRRGAIEGIGCIGKRAVHVAPQLLALRASFPESVDQAIVGLGVPDAVPILLTKLAFSEAHLRVYLVANMAMLGANGHAAGPVLVHLLNDADWEMRVAAARALGWIGYAPAAGALALALADRNDWRLVEAAAEALGRMRLRQGKPALDQAREHWFPRVRAAADRALASMDGAFEYPSPEWPDFFHHTRSPVGQMKPRPRSLVGRPSVDAVDPVRLEALAYDVELGRAKPQVVSVKPRVGLQLSASPRAPFLLGGNRGEFGGELVLSDGVVAQTLLHENVVSIVRLRSDIIVVTGLAHLSESGGALYRVTHDASGRYVASLWKILPGAPLDVAMTTAGDLLVPCTELDVLVSVEGDFRQN